MLIAVFGNSSCSTFSLDFITKTEKYIWMEEHPLVSIISVNFNQLEATMEMLVSLEHSSYPNFEVIVVDNGSVQNPGSKILNRFSDTIFIRSDENLGFAGGNNLGIERASGDFLFFINNDTEIVSGLIYQLVAQFNKIKGLGAISPLIYYHPSVANGRQNLVQFAGATLVHPYTGRNQTLGLGELDNGQFRIPEESPYAHGAAMMISREVLEKVGPMPEMFFLYYEELDWCEQIRKAGYKIYIDPVAKIYHKESLAVGRDSPMKTYFLNRNRLLFIRRNRSFIQVLGFWIFLLFFTIPKNLIVYITSGKWDHIKALLKGVMWNIKHDKNKTVFHGWSMPKPVNS